MLNIGEVFEHNQKFKQLTAKATKIIKLQKFNNLETNGYDQKVLILNSLKE
jgi:hypothetical protein